VKKLLVSALAGLLVSATFFVVRSPSSQAGDPPRSLPGARPTIEAIGYPSLQAALDALPPEGGLVRLPAGTFEIKEPLRIHIGDVTIEGAGTATHIKNVSELGEPALVVEPASAKADPKAFIWRVRLSNFRLTGNPKSGHGVVANRINELFVDGVTSSYHGGDGIRLDNCYEDPRICNSLITYNKQTGLNLIACHDIVVSANQFEENLDAVRCINGFNLCMTGNNLDDHLRDGVVIENTYGSVVAGNMIEECQGRAIVLDRDCYGITLSANVIAHEEGGGVDLAGAHGCAVSANTFTIVRTNALVIGPASGQITVSGNNFSDSTIGNGQLARPKNEAPASGITLRGTTGIAISGNLFSNLVPKALASDAPPSTRILFSGNVVTGAESDHSNLGRSVVGGNLEKGQ
jgi:hypothetical protein